jgi:hypothetical protein
MDMKATVFCSFLLLLFASRSVGTRIWFYTIILHGSATDLSYLVEIIAALVGVTHKTFLKDLVMGLLPPKHGPGRGHLVQIPAVKLMTNAVDTVIAPFVIQIL